MGPRGSWTRVYVYQGTKLLTMKLAKKEHQCLSFILEKNGISIVQDVPINRVSPKVAASIQEVRDVMSLCVFCSLRVQRCVFIE